MTDGTLEITQYGDNIDYCRFWDASAAAFEDRDAEAVSIGGTPFEIWDQPADILFVGNATTFNSVGYKPDTVPVGYGTFTLKYSITSTAYTIKTATPDHTITIGSDVHLKFKDGYTFTITGSTGNDGVYTCDGDSTYSAPDTTITVEETLPDGTDDGTIAAHSIWAPLTAVFNSTSGFTVAGWIAWVIPSDWGLSTVDGDSAYWVNARQSADATTPATCYHLMRSLTLAAPLHAEGPSWNTNERVFKDINGVWQKADFTYQGPDRFRINATAVSFGTSMANISLLSSWHYYRSRLYIIQEVATSGTVAPSTDPYYRTFQGFLVDIPDVFKTPGKMGIQPGAYYPLEFVIDNITTMDSGLGLAL